MATTYCTNAQVSQFLQIAAFSGSTTPTDTVVDDIINDVEDMIDQQVHHAFRTTTVTEEYHDFPAGRTRTNWDWDGVPIFLSHREIILLANKLDTASGDKLEVFDGASWIDWTADFTDDRAGDFWVEPARGILWMRSTQYTPRKRSIRITYRFGASAVPKDVRRATILLSAAMVLSNEDYSMKVPEGEDGIPHTTKVENWRKEAERILAKREEIGIPAI